jgi:1-deoxy-D-xylulose 5-phosphate reductoisomerase
VKRAIKKVAQIFNLPYRRVALCVMPVSVIGGSVRTMPGRIRAQCVTWADGGLQIRDTAEFNSALLAEKVAQIFNLLYRRVALCVPPGMTGHHHSLRTKIKRTRTRCLGWTPGGLQIRDTAEFNSALLAEKVAQIFNLPYRRVALCVPPVGVIGGSVRTMSGRILAQCVTWADGGLQIRDTAEFNSALRGSKEFPGSRFFRWKLATCCD